MAELKKGYTCTYDGNTYTIRSDKGVEHETIYPEDVLLYCEISEDEMSDILIEWGICTEKELSLVESINGKNEKTFCDILYVRTGYGNFQQLLGAEYEECIDSILGKK